MREGEMKAEGRMKKEEAPKRSFSSFFILPSAFSSDQGNPEPDAVLEPFWFDWV